MDFKFPITTYQELATRSMVFFTFANLRLIRAEESRTTWSRNAHGVGSRPELPLRESPSLVLRAAECGSSPRAIFRVPRLDPSPATITSGEWQAQPSRAFCFVGHLLKSFTSAHGHRVILRTDELNWRALRSSQFQPRPHRPLGTFLCPLCLQHRQLNVRRFCL
jgi:hypothetical protein